MLAGNFSSAFANTQAGRGREGSMCGVGVGLGWRGTGGKNCWGRGRAVRWYSWYVLVPVFGRGVAGAMA
jgi:hypothetical protein